MRTFIIGLFIIIGNITLAQDLHFTKYNVETGLSQNTVWCMLQDSQGFIWIGTKDGLNRFDGLTYKIYKSKPSDANMIGNNFIRSLFEDKDKNIWVGTDKGLYIFNTTLERFSAFQVKTSEKVGIKEAVNSIVEDKRGNIWIGVFGQGLFKYSQKNGRLVHFSNKPNDPQSLGSDQVWTVMVDSKNTVWVGTLFGGLNKYLPSKGKFKRYIADGKPGNITDNNIYSLYEDSQQHFWIGSWQSGLILLDRDKDLFSSMNANDPSFSPKNSVIRNIIEYHPGSLLVCTDQGLNIFEIRNKTTKKYRKEALDPRSISDNAIYSILKDVEGNFWIGTYFGGVNFLATNAKPIEHYFPTGEPGSLKGYDISQMIEDPSGNIWIGTEDNGLNYFNTKKRTFTNFSQKSSALKLSNHNLHALLLENNKLWVGTMGSGLDVINLTSRSTKNYRHNLFNTKTLSDDGVFSIYKDKMGTIWVGTIIGLNKYNPKEDNFTRIDVLGLNNIYIYDIIDDKQGNVWFASYEKGLFRYNTHTGKWKNYRHKASLSSSLGYDKVISLWCDAKGRMWIGTEGGGLIRYNYKTDNFITYSEKDGLPNNVIYSIKDDKAGFIWFTTNSGLVRLNPDKWNIKVYKKSDGLQSNQFNYKSGLKTSDGKLYFGGINGINCFYPDSFIFNRDVPPVVFTNFQLFNKDAGIAVKGSPLSQSIRFTHKITLSHKQSILNFEFIALSYIAPNKNQYAYKLEHFDPQWNLIGNEHKVSYTNLPSGEYTLRIKASNNDGIWNDTGASIHIRVLPPWWKSIYAYVFYLITLVISIVAFQRYLIKRAEKKHKLNIDRIKEQKERETYQSKIDFFTNIAHEIRTPLTLISGPLERLVHSDDGSTEIKEEYSLMRKNVNWLLKLVNQLLDFRKIENGHYKLNPYNANMTELLNTIFFRFTPLARQNSIKFIFNHDGDEAYFYFDSEVIIKIVSNLLSNAFKFAKSEIELSLKIIKEEGICSTIEIRVKDDGIGIPPEKLGKIFLPFYQINNPERGKMPAFGTGLGLTFSKSLADLHKGSLYVTSRMGRGSEFILEIPAIPSIQMDETENDTPSGLGNNIIESYVESELVSNKPISQTFPSHDVPDVLIVEDNEDLCNFLLNSLKNEFSITLAPNGIDALEIIKANSFDLVVSDIMMPEMDGITLCSILKKDIRTSHIPVILLTAKTNLTSKIEGLEQGADAYIDKPFVFEYLKAQMINLIDNRVRLKALFARQPYVDTTILSYTKADELFMERTREIIYAHIDDYNFSVDELASLLNMSRSGLHKKLKAISGYSPVDFVRVIRLKRAAEILATGTKRVNEVCLAVGFNTPSYFSKCFQRQFGVLPKDFTIKS